MISLRTPVIAALLAVVAVPAALAQWSGDPTENLQVLGGPGEQVVTHTAVVPDGDYAGFTYVGSYSNASGNYDVVLQLLTPDGVPVFTAGGIMVSDQPQNSWVMDWGLAADADGAAYVTFADIRNGDSNIQLYKIAPDGTHAWGPDGITLTDDADFKGPPCVTVASDGQVVVAWMQAGAATQLRMQRLDASGAVLLAAGGVVVSQASDMSPAGNLLLPTHDGDVILGYVPTYSFSANRQIKAQRFDATGAPVWGVWVMVMDDATMPMGHYFAMTPDGLGGALFCWDVAVGNAFDARVQHVTADGMELLNHNGLNPEAAGPAGQIEPSAVYDPATDTYTMAYVKMNSAQSERGLKAQRFDAAGNRLWGAAGTVLLPQDTDLEVNPSLALVGGQIMGVVEHNLGAFAQDVVLGFGLDASGSLLWGGVVDVAATPASLGRLQAVSNGLTMVCAWEDDRNGTPDVFAQNLNPDGSLGTQVVAIEDQPTTPDAPAAFAARPAYPNPFNPMTTIAFDLPRTENVTLRVYNAAGALVRELVNGSLPAAAHQVTWDGTDQAGRRQPSGVYYYHLVTSDRVATHAMTMIK